MKKNNQISSISKANFLQSVEDYELEIEIQEQKDNYRKKLYSKLFDLAPKIHHFAIENKIKRHFNDDVERYIKSIPLFFKYFSKQGLEICQADSSDLNKCQRKQRRANKDNLLLYSAQLLQLIGLKDEIYITGAMLKLYKERCEKEHEYSVRSRIVNPRNGKILKISTPFEKLKQKKAEVLNIASAFEKFAISKNWGASFITFTLPPAYHSNPANGHNTFNGATPKECRKQLNKKWELLRANLSKEGVNAREDYIGFNTKEVQKDSTLHSHILIFHSEDNRAIIEEKVREICKGEKDKKRKLIPGTKINFDCRKVDEPGKVKFYLVKYLFKSFEYNEKDDCNFSGKTLTKEQVAAHKNMAVRSFYGVRGYSIIGVDNKLTAWRFLTKKAKEYENCLPQDMYECFVNKDFYAFMTKYMNLVNRVSIDGKEIGYKIDFTNTGYSLKNTICDTTKASYLLIEKNCYGFLNMDDNFIQENRIDFNQEEKFTNAKIYSSIQYNESLDIAVEKDKKLEEVKIKYYLSQMEKGFDFYINKAGKYFSAIREELNESSFDGLIEYFDNLKEKAKEQENIQNNLKERKKLLSAKIDEKSIDDLSGYLSNLYVVVILNTKQSSDLLKSASQFEDIEIEDTEYS